MAFIKGVDMLLVSTRAVSVRGSDERFCTLPLIYSSVVLLFTYVHNCGRSYRPPQIRRETGLSRRRRGSAVGESAAGAVRGAGGRTGDSVARE